MFVFILVPVVAVTIAAWLYGHYVVVPVNRIAIVERCSIPVEYLRSRDTRLLPPFCALHDWGAPFGKFIPSESIVLTMPVRFEWRSIAIDATSTVGNALVHFSIANAQEFTYEMTGNFRDNVRAVGQRIITNTIARMASAVDIIKLNTEIADVLPLINPELIGIRIRGITVQTLSLQETPRQEKITQDLQERALKFREIRDYLELMGPAPEARERIITGVLCDTAHPSTTKRSRRRSTPIPVQSNDA